MKALQFIFVLTLAMLFGPVHAAPACMPGLYGTQVGNADYARTDDGWYGYFYCRDSAGKVVPVVFACVHGACQPLGTFAERVTEMKRGANPVQTLQTAWDAQFGNKCQTATGTLKRVCDAGLEAVRLNFPVGEPPIDAQPPLPGPVQPPTPAEVWEIIPISSGIRPSRQVINGALVTMKSPVYLPVLTVCNASVQPSFTTSAGTWMAVTGQQADLRWLCRKQ